MDRCGCGHVHVWVYFHDHAVLACWTASHTIPNARYRDRPVNSRMQPARASSAIISPAAGEGTGEGGPGQDQTVMLFQPVLAAAPIASKALAIQEPRGA